MKYYGLFGSFTAVEDKRDELADILLRAAEMLENNPDCIHYLVSAGNEDNKVYVCETWTDKEAHDKSLEPEDIKNLIKTALPLISSMDKIAEVDVLGGKGMA